MKYLVKIIFAIFFWSIFILVIFNLPYPQDLEEANFLQISIFFSSLFLAILFTLKIVFKRFSAPALLTAGIILTLILKALDSLNLVTGIIVLTLVSLLISYFLKRNSPAAAFQKIKKRNLYPLKVGSDLTKLPKIPKLTRLRKKNG